MMNSFLALLFLAGLLLAGSDGPWFPLPNAAGVTMVFCFAAVSRRRFGGESA